MVHPWHGKLFNNKKEQITDTHEILEESPESCAKRGGKANSKGYRLYYSICVTLLKWQNDRNGEHMSRSQGLSRVWVQKGGIYYCKGQHEGPLQQCKYSLPWLYQCQYPCDVIL